MAIEKSSVKAMKFCIYPFLANVSTQYPSKKPEYLLLSIVFKWYKMGSLARNRLTRNCVSVKDQKRVIKKVVTFNKLS